MERTDAAGRWVSDDGGLSWSLAEPSQDWLDERDATDDDPGASPLAEALADVEAATTVAQLSAATAAYLSLLNP